MGKTLQRVLLKNFLLRSLDFSIGNSLSPCKKTYASTHVFGNRELTTWRERQESGGWRQGPAGSVQSLGLFILEKQTLRGNV